MAFLKGKQIPSRRHEQLPENLPEGIEVPWPHDRQIYYTQASMKRALKSTHRFEQELT